MRFFNSIFLCALRPMIWSSETLAATVPLIPRRDQNATHNGNATNTKHAETPESSGTGLGSDPVNTGHGLSHDKHFFESTYENIKASNFGAAYADWIKGVDKNSAAWRDRLSEPDFFAKTVLEWPDDVNCGVAYNGCDARPLCDDISGRISNRTRARQICYIFDSFHHVSLVTGQIHEQSKAAQAAGDAKCRELASTFFRQFDPDVQKSCEMITNLVKAGITAIMFAALAAAPLMAPAALGGVIVGEEAVVAAAGAEEVAVAGGAEIAETVTIVESEAGEIGVEVGEGIGEGVEGGSTGIAGGEGGEVGGAPGTEGVEGGEGGGGTGTEGGDNPGAGNGGNEGNGGPPEPPNNGGGDGPGSPGGGTNEGTGATEEQGNKVSGAKVPWKLIRTLDAHGNPKTLGWHRVSEGKTAVVANALVALPVTIAGPAMQEGICSHFPNASPQDLEKWTTAMSDKILLAAEDYRMYIDRSLKATIKGSGVGDNGTFVEPFTSILAEKIYKGDYVRLTDYERNVFVEETSKLEMIMTHHFINSAISISLKSAMCYLHCTTNIDESAKGAKDDGTFTPEPGTICRPQCWQNWGWEQTTQLKMFGLDSLMNDDNHWGTNAAEFLTNSYNHWQWSRFSPGIMFPTVDQLREGTISNSTSGAAVPVCHSPQPIKGGWALPCVCGDELGNETVSFFRETNFRSWVASEGGKGVAEACQQSFETDKTWPVQAYLAFCHLGWHFPVEADKHSKNSTNKGKHRFSLGADVMCEQAEKEAREVMERGGSSTDVNCSLCWLSQTGKAIKDNQRSYVHHNTLDHHNKYNFEKACEDQMDKNKVCNLIN